MNGKETLCAVFLIACLCAASSAWALDLEDIPKIPPENDLEVREFDELVLVINPANIWKGEFRRDEKGDFEITPNGKLIFDILVGELQGISHKPGFKEILEVRLKQTEEEVWRKKFKKLPKGRLDVPRYVKEAKACVEKGYLDLAEDLLRRALVIDDKNLELYLETGALLRQRFKFDDELRVYQAGLDAKLPRPEGILAQFGDLLTWLGLHGEAEEKFKEALSLDPGHVESLLGLGKLYLTLRRFRESADRLTKAARNAFDKEKKGKILKCLGRAQLKLGELENAKKSFEDAAFNLPEDREVKLAVGSVYYLTGELSLAKQKSMEILEITESDLASGGVDEGEEDEEEGEDKDEDKGNGEPGEGEESDEWGPATEFDSFKSKAMGNLALCLLKEGALTQAEYYLRLSAGLDPTTSFPWVVLGYLREKQERWGDAREAYEKGLVIEPMNPYAHYSLGVLHLRGGEPGSARAAFLKAADADPDFTDALVKLGRLAVRENRGKEGILYFQRALALCPGVADWHVNLGIAHAVAGRPDLGGEQFKKALALDPVHAIAQVGILYSLYYAPRGGEESYGKMKRLLEEPGALPANIVAYLKRVKAMIETNRDKVQWLDDFERPDSDQAARKWEQREGRGPIVRIHKGRVAMEGSQRRAGETVLEREIRAEKFVRFEADIFVKDISNFDAGLVVTHRVATGSRLGDIRAGIRLGKNVKGNLVVWEWEISGGRWKEKAEFGNWPVTEDGGNRLVIEHFKDIEDPREDFKLRFLVNGTQIGDPYVSDRFRRAFRTGEIWTGIFAFADGQGINVKVEVDNVRLVTWK